ncbi:hypothetical protein A1O3_00574 [Capronia epimyces CBS 606.96]|uniref:Uncharacterized protein n=1 Tax=Capronia epimyces CBS 606.96 TaxID=1182542 RepID=W9ZBY8_9EURO|nr:uncharacterized protein A1O3_00574 [Capronia epimyces CBS 606.96]EXJ92024.1 hypothetical protein A1O3_00574 [Capronia epimyces CBS 606.96]
MPKLQKQQPPAYSGKANTSTPLQTTVPYERLPVSAQQPVLVTSAVKPSSYHDLPSTNPFSSNYVPPADSSPAQSNPFSPVSPLVESRPAERLSQPETDAPQPQRTDPAPRRSVGLRRLDGKPYPGPQSTDKPGKPVKVAKDMFDGALPPVYKREASDPINPTEVAQILTSTSHACTKCGRNRGEAHAGQDNNCTQCGKRKASVPPATSAPTPATVHGRTTSEGTVSHRSRLSESTAGPSNSPGSTHAKYCAKCGKYKRPPPEAVEQSSIQESSTRSGPIRAPIPAANHPAVRMHQAGLSIQPNMAPASNHVYPQIDVIPPSASTYRPVNSPFANYGDDSPLVEKATKQEFKLFRNSSLARSLSRRLSRKDKSASAPLPSQQLAGGENPSGEQSAGRLINMISSAMQGTPNDQDAQYARLDAGEQPDRPATPFSFVGGKDEQDAFEMTDIRERNSFSDRGSLKEVLEVDTSASRPEHDPSTIPQDTIDVLPRSKSAVQHSQHLSVGDTEQKPQITRFKSLRSGVSRMNSTVSRSTSLKRLGSLKTVHHNWYRNDMAIEGATADHAVPAF